ncbi:hypothetical protein [Puniceibacterium sp. IMCC21224]|uniref:hypothetical protein n=1 Tax=Puniceibacterium sp. IMCC21224 TaxID=1618204 RepID=UPI00064E0E76|nr:hypothetical protein [Puniceibacterium sp. IMCC21224]KMK68225.1 hypothetical protein IMCC21224_113106 [Puniceibacterium sp. IMCC21224]
MTLATLEAEAQTVGLTIRGAFHPTPGDMPPAGCATLLLLGPNEPVFWQHYAAAPESRDAGPDPLDRWSKRVIGALALGWGGLAQFPSDGPPYPPFQKWAESSGRCWPSPTGLLVHDDAGLLISFRGAVALPHRIVLTAAAVPPCTTCAEHPCETACPVAALRPDAPYDVPACQAFLRTPQGADCRHNGCLVRRACPASARLNRAPEQAAFHMAAFVKD